MVSSVSIFPFRLLNRWYLCVLSLWLNLLALASPVTVTNGSFEFPNLNGNASGQQAQNLFPASPPGWTFVYEQGEPTNSQNWGVLDPPSGAYGRAHPLPATFEGNQVAYINLNTTSAVARADSAILGTLESNRIYVLDVAVGGRNNNQWPNIEYSAGLVDDQGTELGTFAAATLDLGSEPSFNIRSLHYELDVGMQVPASAGRGYFVRIRAANTGENANGSTFSQANFDNVAVQSVTNVNELWAELPKAEVKRDAGGTPRLSINDTAVNPTFFLGWTDDPVVYDEMRLAASAGVNLVQIALELPWLGTSDVRFEHVLEANSNAWILPRISLFQPAWYRSAHASEEFVDQNGQEVSDVSGASLASETFIQTCKDQLEMLIRHLENSPYASRIIGYHINYLNTGEWFYPDYGNRLWDYSEVNRQRFIQWLQGRYATVTDLNAAWHKSYAAFADVQIPSTNDWLSFDDGVFRDPSKEHAVPDYAEYHSGLVADRICELAAFIKSLTGGKSLVATFYGYTAELIGNSGTWGPADAGHLAMKRLLACPHVDIVCSPLSYYDRDVGRPMDMHGVVDAAGLRGKLYLQEDDSNTYLIDPWTNSWNYKVWYTNEWDTFQCLRRNYGNVVGHNQGMWWFDLFADGRFDSSEVWTNNALVVHTYDDVVANQSPFSPQIAVLFDEETFFWIRAASYHLTFLNTLDLRSLFQECGASVGYYFIEDLPKLPSSVKLLVFSNTHRLDANEQTLISQAKTNGRTFLWLYAPGYVNETNLSVSGMQQATGFKCVRNPDYSSVLMHVTSTNSPITRDLPDHEFGSGNFIAPNFYVDASVGSPEVLGRYYYNNQPGFVVKNYGTWKSIFSGGLNLTVPMLRSIARYAGVNLLADGDTLDATNAVNFIGNYMYVYAMNNAGRRCFQLPGEKVPNGNFEKFTGALPTNGFGRWFGPSYGLLPACQVVNTNAAAGSNSCATGAFVSGPGQYSEPLAIRLQAETGKTYQASCSIYLDGLNASAATNGNYLLLVFQPHVWSTNSWSAQIAGWNQVALSNKVWVKLSGSFTFTGSAAPYQNELFIVLKVYGAYSANNILIDNVSVREAGCEPVDVTELVSNTALGHDVTSWADNFALNEQKIFRLKPAAAGPFCVTAAGLAGPGWLQIDWESPGPNYHFTVEEATALPGTWQAATGTNMWPILETRAYVPVVTSSKFFRVRAERF